MYRIEGFNPLPRGGEYIYAKLAGPATLEAAVQRFLDMLEACQGHGLRKVLFDCRGRVQLSQSFKVTYLKAVADIHRLHVRQGGDPIRLAFLADLHNVPADGVEGPMAHSLGLGFQLFACPAKAMRFLDLNKPDFTVRPQPDHVRVIVSGQADPQSDALRFNEALRLCQLHDLNKILFDYRGLGYTLTETLRYEFIGMTNGFYQQYVREGGRPIQVAFIGARRYAPDDLAWDFKRLCSFELALTTSLFEAFVFLGLHDSAEMRLHLDSKTDFVYGLAEGIANIQHGTRGVQMSLEKCRETDSTKILWDISRLRGRYIVPETLRALEGFTDLYRDHVEQGGQPVDIAFVRPPGDETKWYIIEDGASADGLRLWYTDSHAQAMDWLNVFDASLFPWEIQQGLAVRLLGRGIIDLSG